MTFLAQAVQVRPAGTEVAIIGDGKRSLAIGSFLSLSGHSVRLWSPDGKSPAECEIRQRQASVVHKRAKTHFATVTKNLASVLEDAPIVILSSPTTEYGAILACLTPYLANGQTVVLANAPLGAALQFSKGLGEMRPELKVNTLEMGSLFDFVKIEGETVIVSGPRVKVSICGISRNETRRGLSVASNLWSGLVPTSNILERGFTEAERLLRPALRLFYMLGTQSGEIRDLSQSLTDGLVSVIAGIGLELQSIARAFGVVVPGLGQILTDYYGASGDSFKNIVLDAGQSMISEESVVLREDSLERLRHEVGETFVLLSAFATLSRLPVPLVDAVIELASAVTNCSLRREGRVLSDLGLVGFDVQEVVELVNA